MNQQPSVNPHPTHGGDDVPESTPWGQQDTKRLNNASPHSDRQSDSRHHADESASPLSDNDDN